MYVKNLMNSLWDIRIFLGLVPKESHCILSRSDWFSFVFLFVVYLHINAVNGSEQEVSNYVWLVGNEFEKILMYS